ncbi:MAG: ATP-binding cassette domain-containing protein [Candidatus Norongarragalinales archaeon]
MDLANVVEARELTKKFGGFTAVNRINLSVRRGELFGLLGPNGAGKSTTMFMLSTILPPTGGSAVVNGFDVVREAIAVRRSIGMVFQDYTLDSHLTGFDNLDIHGRLYGLPASERRKKIAEVLNLVELNEWRDKLVKTYSGGMKRRLEIARGLLHTPKVLFLDEPTLGLDAQTRHHIWDYLRKLKRRGVTMILTTHYLEEADELCDRVAIIDHGEIRALGSPSELKKSVAAKTAVQETNSRVARREPSLEDAFLAFTGRGLRDAATSSEQKRVFARMRGWR